MGRSKSKDTAADYFLAGRNLSWWIVGASIFASNIGSEHVVGLAGSGAKDGVAMAHYELHAWCLLMLAWVFVPFYARSMVFTMPEFLEKRFSIGSRYVLSIVSLITFVVSKIAVGIFAGGVVFSALCRKCTSPGPRVVIDSFWIGSVLVILLTGLYTVLGGMRAVAYNDAVQTIVLIGGSATLTIYGLLMLGDGSLVARLGAVARYLRLRHVQPLETAAPAGRQARLAAGTGQRQRGQHGSRGLVLQQPLSLAGHGHLRPGDRPVVLVYRPVHRAAGLGRAGRTDGPARQHLRRLPEALSRLPVHHSRADLLALAKPAARSRTGADRRPNGKAVAAQAQAAFPMMVVARAARRAARSGRGRIALGLDGLAGRRVQRLLDALYRRPLREVEAQGHAATDRADRDGSPRR